MDQVSEIAARYNVSAMPTFKILVNGKVVDEMRGAMPGRLKELCAKYCGQPVKAGSA